MWLHECRSQCYAKLKFNYNSQTSLHVCKVHLHIFHRMPVKRTRCVSLCVTEFQSKKHNFSTRILRKLRRRLRCILLPPPRLCVRECGVDISRFDSVDASAYNSAIELASSHFYYSYAESWWSLPANTHISSIRLVALSVNAFRTSVIILLAEIARKYAVWFDENIICIHTLPDCFYFLLVARMQIPCISVQ